MKKIHVICFFSAWATASLLAREVPNTAQFEDLEAGGKKGFFKTCVGGLLVFSAFNKEVDDDRTYALPIENTSHTFRK